MIALFYRLGIWNSDDNDVVAGARGTRIKLFFSAYYLCYFLSLTIGAITDHNLDEGILLMDFSIVVYVAAVKLWFIFWKNKQIAAILDKICNFSVKDLCSCKMIEDKLKSFITFVIVLLVTITIGVIVAAIVPLFRSDRKLFLNIALPFDPTSNQILFWLGNAFFFGGSFLTITSFLLSFIIWYSMINCALRYEALGNEIRNMGTLKIASELGKKRKRLTAKEKQEAFHQDLINAIDSHQKLREYYTATNRLKR